MYFEVDFDAPQTLDALTLSMHWEIPGLEVYGKTPDGKWRKLEHPLVARSAAAKRTSGARLCGK